MVTQSFVKLIDCRLILLELPSIAFSLCVVIISLAVRNDQGMLIEHTHKSRRIASRAYVDAIARLRARDNHNGGVRNKQAAASVKLVKYR